VATLIVPTTTADGTIVAEFGVPIVTENTTLLTVAGISSTGINQWRSYLFFPAPALPPGAVVQSVDLNYYIRTRIVDNGTMDVYICSNACAGSTLSISDWNDVVAAGRLVGADPTYPLGWKTWNLLVSDLNLSGYTNVEILLNQGGASNSLMILDSASNPSGNAAYLEIEYSLPAAGPSLPLLGFGG